MTPKLELRDVVKSFGGRCVVDRLSLTMARGEFLSLLGPSGCGKSTTLSMIAGFLAPDSGEIRLGGTVVNRTPPRRRGIGLVFQDYAVFSRLTVRQNLAFGLEARGMPRQERSAEVDRIAARLDLSEILDRRGAQLNMSEMQRVALARVLVTKPSILLLDEPMSNLDAALRGQLRTELKRIQKSLDQTVLYVTHDQVEAMSMSDRIAIMRAGELLQVASPEVIYHRPRNRFVAEFIGDPPINILRCEVRSAAAGLVVDTACHRGIPLGAGELRPGQYWLGVRPHVLLVADRPCARSAECRVAYIENLGAEHVAHLEYDETLLRTVGAPGFAQVGDVLSVALDPLRCHFFDLETGEAVELHGQEARYARA